VPHRRLDSDGFRQAFNALGDRLDWSGEVELVIVGGAAAILTGLLTRRVTCDCDVAIHSREAWGAIDRAARDVARDQGLSPDWLNAEFQQVAHRMPERWRDRCRSVGTYGVVTVVAVGRSDFIAMKIIAGRAEDIADLRELKMTADEAAFVRGYLDILQERHARRETEKIRDARELLEVLTS
jgi:hypothetical protein